MAFLTPSDCCFPSLCAISSHRAWRMTDSPGMPSKREMVTAARQVAPISWMTSLGAGTPRASFHSPPSATCSVPSGPRAYASWTTWFIAADPHFTSLRPPRDVDVDLDATVLRPAFIGRVARDRARRAHADHQHLARVDAAAGQEVPDGFGAPQRKLLVVGDGSQNQYAALQEHV